VPPVFSDVHDCILTSDDVFELTRVPESLAVIGTGIIGLELGQALARLRTRVTFLDRASSVGPLTDPELQRYAQSALRRRIDLELGAEIVSAVADDRGRIGIGWMDAQGRARSAEFEHVLVSTGRRPNLVGLDLERAGLDLDERGVPKFDTQTMQCGN